jgi:uncharacterized membrane protein YvlD (DUF360 family)
MTQNQANKGGLIRNLLINTLSIFAVSYILSGIQIDSFVAALIVSVVMAILNVTLKPFLIVITIPLTIITFGLFLLGSRIFIFGFFCKQCSFWAGRKLSTKSGFRAGDTSG